MTDIFSIFSYLNRIKKFTCIARSNCSQIIYRVVVYRSLQNDHNRIFAEKMSSTKSIFPTILGNFLKKKTYLKNIIENVWWLVQAVTVRKSLNSV